LIPLSSAVIVVRKPKAGSGNAERHLIGLGSPTLARGKLVKFEKRLDLRVVCVGVYKPMGSVEI
jgi:hypothetical protein